MMGPVLFGTLFATALCGWLIDQSVPYFPIELSRTATGPYSRWIFSLGLTLSCALLLWQTRSCFILVVGVLLLAWVDDEVSHTVHMFGVYLAFAGALLFVQKSNASMGAFFFAFVIFMLRVVIKAMTVLVLEFETPAVDLFDWKRIMDEAIFIMRTGKVKHPMTLIIFKAMGLLQWVVIWMVYQILAFQIKST